MNNPVTLSSILLCEDEKLMLTALDFRLRKYGYQVQRATSHNEAMTLIKKTLPAVVIVDLFTPQLSGLDFITELRSIYPALPIIAMSTHEEGDNLLLALACGANDFLLKPINPIEMMLRIRTQLAKN
jgi:two-component system, OmpR family, response regulator VicR